MNTSNIEYYPDQIARIDHLLEEVEYLPIKMAVVDYLNTRDGDGLVTEQTDLSRRFGTRDLRHVAIYDLTVVRLNRAARVAQVEPAEQD